MLREKLKEAARKAALKAFGMEREASARDVERPKGTGTFDPAVIPRVVAGSGDTPGPNHKEDLGRTWLAAQIASGVSPVLVDLRHPRECVGGMLPGAINLPGLQYRDALHRLPDKARGVLVYDQLGREEAIEAAAWFRDQGYAGARRLVGGYAEWIEHDEPVTVPHSPPGGRYHVGVEVVLRDGRRAWVQEAVLEGGLPRYTLLLPDGAARAGVSEDELVG